ncbi:saccharopine dehydrogenase family protein [Nannocystis bainbridge]|uniref:Saccharopine dehydrogenase NADP-binding domain-containing protein n=1 Tax=Nannocystis bainbridge TaxID=2995303 RepID=A0ABT5DX22_9BACT|nr:saccharopine dehydrogenase NADP-binding domain-containing protein [Nannocystis bainbridge]MDC0718129.1 saccharopine dehydrogenase NADP-binding domain-containing protein [Nannocystis bainbridge]
MTPPAASARDWDITVFGATGFVGRLCAAYLAAHAPPEVRLAVAGRSRDKLAAVAAELGREVGIVVADTDDPAALARMAASSRVILTTVGPYVRYGEPVVRACVEQGADYLDLTGEPAFVESIIAAYDAAARARGVLVLPCCGFDSIPTDLGVLWTTRALPQGRPLTIAGYLEGRGSFSGGTLASALGVLGAPTPSRKPRSGAPSGRKRAAIHYQRELGRWAVPMPTIDPQIARRSARLRGDYGPEFSYAHYVAMPRLYHVGLAIAGAGALVGAAKIGPLRRLLSRMHPPGSGPAPEVRAKSWFKVTFVGRAGDDPPVIAEVSGGDPGYDETAKMAGETALCLVLQRDMCKETGGVSTTAAACGELLIERLQAAGLRFVVR